MEAMLVVDDFKAHVGKMFRFLGTPHALPLDRISSLREEIPPGGKRIPFTLIFVGPRSQDHLPEGLYDCEIEDGPTYRIHVTPIHTLSRERQEYQAVFN